jgi:hypothetical protein
MFWTITVTLMVLWLLGVVTSHAMGGLIHLLLAAVIVLVLFRLTRERRPA